MWSELRCGFLYICSRWCKSEVCGFCAGESARRWGFCGRVFNLWFFFSLCRSRRLNGVVAFGGCWTRSYGSNLPLVGVPLQRGTGFTTSLLTAIWRLFALFCLEFKEDVSFVTSECARRLMRLCDLLSSLFRTSSRSPKFQKLSSMVALPLHKYSSSFVRHRHYRIVFCTSFSELSQFCIFCWFPSLQQCFSDCEQ